MKFWQTSFYNAKGTPANSFSFAKQMSQHQTTSHNLVEDIVTEKSYDFMTPRADVNARDVQGRMALHYAFVKKDLGSSSLSLTSLEAPKFEVHQFESLNNIC